MFTVRAVKICPSRCSKKMSVVCVCVFALEVYVINVHKLTNFILINMARLIVLWQLSLCDGLTIYIYPNRIFSLFRFLVVLAA